MDDNKKSIYKKISKFIFIFVALFLLVITIISVYMIITSTQKPTNSQLLLFAVSVASGAILLGAIKDGI